MKKNRALVFAAVFLAALVARSQTAAAEFTLQAAIDYALKHNAGYLNAEADANYNRYKKNEIMGQGFPQVNASVDLKDNVKLPTSLLPGQFFGAPPGTYIPVSFGVQYVATAGVSASQLIFNSSYIVGLQASKELINLSQKSIVRSKAETSQSVAKAYYGVLVNRERIKLLDLNIERLKTLRETTGALNENGFVEKIDVDRLQVSYNNLITEREKTARLVELTEVLLKFQMGYDLSQPITLTDKLDNAVNTAELASIPQTEKVDVSKRPEYMVLQSQVKLNEFDLKRHRLSYLPTLVAYGNYSTQFQSNELNFDRKNWYPFAIIGATLNIGIFDGLQTNARVQQAKINVLKAQNTFNQVKASMELEAQSAAIAYKNAAVSVDMQEKNIGLARNIFEVAKKKYEQGVGSSLELNTAENDLRQAETNYYNALYDLIVARIDYQKATGTLVK
jgi:outer membrane protein